MELKSKKIVVVGLGYVGLPLAVEFSRFYKTIGYDINQSRVEELKKGIDSTKEVDTKPLLDKQNSQDLIITSDQDMLKTGDIYIITVPTPIDSNRNPDLTPLMKASQIVGKYLKSNDIVIYESTVFPGATEDVCAPILEAESSLILNKDFFIGYSPERINPGDKIHSLTNIIKVTSGSTSEIADLIDKLYSSIIVAGTFKASSIKVAEAAKVIENTQRDLNIAFVNELSEIFYRLNIDTTEVLKAAETKWNFLPFKPGLVGGHCIGVDPYYLAQKALSAGYNPEVILAGRRINDSMGKKIAERIIKGMIKKEITIKGAKILVLGITFKENCPDIRNTKVIDLIQELKEYGCDIDVYDPIASMLDVENEFSIKLTTELIKSKYDSIILAVGHERFNSIEIDNLLKSKSYVFDIKSFLSKSLIDERL